MKFLWQVVEPALVSDSTHDPAATKSRLDQEIIEDAATRHEQFTEEADRWHDDK